MLKKYKERKGDRVHIAKVQNNLCKHHHSKLHRLWKGKKLDKENEKMCNHVWWILGAMEIRCGT